MRLLRGRVAIRPDEVTHPLLHLPQTTDPNDRSIKRTGVVIAMGPPAETPLRFREGAWIGGVEIPPGFAVGDRVVYAYGQIDVPLDGEPDVAWCSQEEILGVVEP